MRHKRVLFGGIALATGLSAIGVVLVVSGTVSLSGPPPRAQAAATPDPAATPVATMRPSPTASPSPRPRPSPTPTPAVTPAPLTGLPVAPEAAARRPIAVMIDDLRPARPQSGFTAASVVWHAPAEGGVPRYMLVFAEQIPGEVGPVRSARDYYIGWAAEWQAMFVHAGGSPGALRTLRDRGDGDLVFDADEFRWGGGEYLWRSRERSSPHNVYTDGEHLRALAERLGADDRAQAPAWRFGPDAPLAERPAGGSLEVSYLANDVAYAYDRESNTYVRSVTGDDPQVDAATDEPVAPKNVVIMLVPFAPLDDGQPEQGRLEADVVGSGRAWIASNGRTVRGTWRKDAIDEPTRFFDPAGRPVTLVAGQTFVQVLDTDAGVVVEDGRRPTSTPRPD